jgi:hypothetical protein
MKRKKKVPQYCQPCMRTTPHTRGEIHHYAVLTCERCGSVKREPRTKGTSDVQSW